MIAEQRLHEREVAPRPVVGRFAGHQRAIFRRHGAEPVRHGGAIAAGEYDELSRRLAAIAVWVRASLIHGGPQPPPEELEEPGRHDKPGESGA